MKPLTFPHGFTKPPFFSASANKLTPVAQPQKKKPETDEFAYAIAHEIRNPLTAIKLAGEMLRSMTGNKDQRILLNMIVSNSVRINNLLTDFLTSFQTNEPKSEKHSIHELLDEILTLSEDRIRLKNISVRKIYASRNFIITMNRPKMKIALTNIIINAIEALNSEKGELKLVTKLVTGKLVIQIEDNGCGISNENLKKIFNPYFTNKPGGLGLGLATTCTILQSNKVGYYVKSEEGVGTCFILLFDKNQKYNPFR